jgi:hypothetical protein
LERIEESSFSGSGLKSILIPSCVIVVGKSSFYACKSFQSVTFEDFIRGHELSRSSPVTGLGGLARS